MTGSHGKAASGPRTTFVLDCDGVLYLHDTPIPGAASVLAALEASGAELLFCTNNSSRTPTYLAQKLARLLGYEASPDQVLTSAQAAAKEIRRAGLRSSAVLGMEGVVHALQDEGIEIGDSSANALVVGIDFALDYEKVRLAADIVRRGGLFVATNTDETYPVPEGLWPGAGMVVAAVAAAGGRPPDLVAGKPHPPMVSLIRERAAAADIIVVGDRPETDLALAHAGGWRSVAVLTGVVSRPSEIPSHLTPDHVLDSVADLLSLVF